MFEFLDEIDPEHPHFYARPCTRCLRCEQPILPTERKGETNFWFCEGGCKRWVNVGLGSRNQVTREIRWLERYEKSNKQGTLLCFSGIPPEPAFFIIDEDYVGFCDDDVEGPPITILKTTRPRLECWAFHSLLSAMMRFRRLDPSAGITFDYRPMTQHEIMEAIQVLKNTPPWLARANLNRA